MESNSLTLYPQQKNIRGMLFLSAGFIAASIWMIQREENFGWVGLVFFGLGFLLTLILLLPNAAYLRLGQDGFETRSMFKTRFTAWNEVHEFQVASINRQQMVCFNYTAAHRQNQQAKQFSRELAGFEGSVSTLYGNSPKELAALMNAWKLRHDLAKAAMPQAHT